MRCTLGKEERVTVEVREVATKVSEKKEMAHNVPPEMLNDLQRATRAFEVAQRKVLDYLHETEQPEPTWG